MQITINGESRTLAAPMTVAELLATVGLDARKVAVERNLEIVPRSGYHEIEVAPGDRLEIVHFIGGGAPDSAEAAETVALDDPLVVAGTAYRSRLLVGTGKYKDFAETARAIEASGAEIVTVAVRRVNVTDPNQPMLVDYVDPRRYTYLPNTAGCFTAADAVRTLR
ncbi:MAG: sulfur carrier protein ThiS, partial [Rhodospirillales bacterium]